MKIIKIQTLSVVRVPRTTEREEWWLFAPKPPTRNNVPGPYQWAHRTPDTTQAARKHPGQLQTKIQTLPVARVPRTTGREGKRQEWGLFAPKPPTGAPRPQTPSVGSPHIGHDTSWRHPQLPENILGSHKMFWRKSNSRFQGTQTRISDAAHQDDLLMMWRREGFYSYLSRLSHDIMYQS